LHNHIIILFFVISIVAILMYIPLKYNGVLPIRDNLYRPPIKPKPDCEMTMEEVKKRLHSPTDIDRILLKYIYKGKECRFWVIKC